MRFPRLKVLEDILTRFGSAEKEQLRYSCVVCVQHLLASNGSMLNALLRAGVQPNNLFVAGKFYSTNVDVWSTLKERGIRMMPHSIAPRSWRYTQRIHEEIGALWSEAARHIRSACIQRVIVIDDGGFCLRSVPVELLAKLEVTGIEQTTSGVTLGKFPQYLRIVDVASSAAKKVLESPLIASAVAEKAERIGASIPTDAVIGVAGIGNIGSAVLERYARNGHTVIAYDRNRARLKSCARHFGHIVTTSDIPTLVENADVVFGCTGADFLRRFNWSARSTARKIHRLRLLSCSSRDIEFLSVLDRYYSSATAPHSASLRPLSVKLGGCSVVVERGGYPINFDGSIESVPSQDIQLTRGLILAAVLQTVTTLTAKSGQQTNRIPLDASLQRRVVSKWLECAPAATKMEDRGLASKFSSVPWITQNSIGSWASTAG